MSETYVDDNTKRVLVKEICNMFFIWLKENYGRDVCNNIGLNQVYSILRNLPEYSYVRYKEGYWLKGIDYKPRKLTLNIISDSGAGHKNSANIESASGAITSNIRKSILSQPSIIIPKAFQTH